MDDRGIVFRFREGTKVFPLFLKPAGQPIQPLSRLAQDVAFPVDKGAGREAEHRPPPNTEIKRGCSFMRLPGLHVATLSAGAGRFLPRVHDFSLSSKRIFKSISHTKERYISCVITIDALKLELHIIYTKQYKIFMFIGP